MKEKFIRFANKMELPVCFIMICFSIFKDYMDSIPYVFFIRIIILLAAITLIISGIIKPVYKKETTKSNDKNRSLKERFYLNSYELVMNVFVWYFCLFVILQLDRISVVFSYLMLLIFGVCLGYRIANTADTYNKKK